MPENSIGKATIEIGADASGLADDVEKQSSSELKDTGSHLGKSLASGMGTALKVGAAATGAVIAGILGVALTNGFQRLDAIDAAKAKLDGLGHSGKEIQSIMDSALASVKGTAFGLGEAASQSATLVAAGIKPGKDLTRTLKLLADTATISGTSLEDIGQPLGKVVASGKLTTDVMQQLQDRGIPVLQFLAKQYGVTSAEAQKMVTKGEVSFGEFRKAMETNLGGAALASGDTFQGGLANVQAALGRLGAKIEEPIFEALKGVFQDAIPAIDAFSENLQPVVDFIGAKVAPALAAVSKKVFAFIATFDFKAAAKRVEDFVTKVRDWFKELSPGKAAGEVGGLWATITEAFKGIDWAALGTGATEIKNSFAELGTSLSKDSGKIIEGLTSVIVIFADALKFLADHMDVVIKLLPVLIALWAAYKASQAANNAAATLRLPLTAAQVTANLALASSNKALAASNRGLATSTTQVIATQEAETAATSMGVLARIRSTVATIAGRVAQTAASAATKIATAFQWLFNAALTANPIGLIIAGIAALVAALIWFFTQTKLGQQIWAGFVAFLTSAWQWLSTTAVTVFTAIADFISGIWDTIVTTFTTVFEFIKGLVTAYFQAYLFVITTVFNAVKGFIVGAWNGIVTVFTTVFTFLKNLFTSAFEVYRGIVIGVFSAIRTFIGNVWAGIKATISTILNGVKALATGVRDAISKSISTAVTTVKGLKDKVLGVFSGAAKWLYNAGRDVIQGLLNGIGSLAKTVGEFFLSKVPGWMRGPLEKALGIASPSKVFEKIGKNVILGLVKGLNDGRDDAKKAISGLIAEIKKGVGSSHAETALVAYVKKQGAALDALWKQYDANAKKLTAAKDVLASLRADKASMAASAADRVTGGLDLTQAIDTTTGVVTFAGVAGVVSTYKALAGKYSTAMKALIKAGFSPAFIQMIAGYGLQAATDIANAILSGTPDEQKALQGDFNAIGSTATSVGNALASDFYDAGIKAQAGLVAGLTKKSDALEKAINSLATKVTSAVKKALGIASPSKVFAALGRATGQGFIDGITATQAGAVAAMDSLAGALVPAASLALAPMTTTGVPPSPVAGSSTPGTTDALGTGNVYQVSVTVPMDDLKQLQTFEDFMDLLRVRTRMKIGSTDAAGEL